MARELSPLKTAVTSPILSATNVESQELIFFFLKKVKNTHESSYRQKYNANFFLSFFFREGDKPERLGGYLRVKILIYSSNKRVLWCCSQHGALRWCTPYVPICTKLRHLVLFACVHYCLHIHKHAFNFSSKFVNAFILMGLH